MTMTKKEAQKYWRQLGTGLVELLFPRPALCPICQQEARLGQGLGRNCLQQILLVTPPLCPNCGRPLRLNAAAQPYCQQCRTTKYYFSKARAVGLYEGALREYLAELKYRYRPDLGLALGSLLVDWVKAQRSFGRADLIIPVPIHQQKLDQRGYNQAELLAAPLANYWGVRLNQESLVRAKATESQSKLTKQERFRNLRQAFRVVNPEPVRGRKVLLIDDILTTGATASEAARSLLRAGAHEVKVLTLAVGLIDKDWLSS